MLEKHESKIMTPEYINRVGRNLESLCDTMDSISDIEASSTTDFSTTRNEFFAKSGALDTLRGADAHEGWFQKTLKGFDITHEHMNETLNAAMRILSDESVTPSQKDAISERVAKLHQRLEFAEFGMIRMQGNSRKDPRRYILLTHSMVQFREGVEATIKKVEQLGKIQRTPSLPPNKHLGLNFGVSINKLPPDIRREYIQVLQVEVRNSESGQSHYLAMANEYFYQKFPGAKLKAKAIHQKFQQEHGKADFDRASSTVKPTAAQFAAAIKILQEEYPGYVECAYDDNQRAAVANLLQIILCGEDLLPDTEFCIQIKETEGKSTTPYETDFPGDKSYAMHRIDIFESRKDNVPSESMMREEMRHASAGFSNAFVGELIDEYKPLTAAELLKPDFDITVAIARLRGSKVVRDTEPTESSIFPEKQFLEVFHKYLSAPLPKQDYRKSDQSENIRKSLIAKLERDEPFSDLMIKSIADELHLELSVVNDEIVNIWPDEQQREYQKRKAQVGKLIEDTTLSEDDIQQIAGEDHKKEEVEALLRLLALDALTSAVAQKTDSLHFEHNIHASISSFAKDCIERTLNDFTIGEQPSQKLGEYSAPVFFERSATSYLSHLSTNTADATLQIQELNESDLLKALNTINLPSSDDSNFSEEAFLTLLQPHLRAYFPTKPESPTEDEQKIYDALIEKIKREPFTESMIDDIAEELDFDFADVEKAIGKMWEPIKQKRYNQLMGAVVHSRIPQDQIAQLASSTGRPSKEIEPILRLKFLQMMGLMNQSVMAKFTEELVPMVFEDFEHPLDPSYSQKAPPAGTANTFRFTQDFRGLTYEPVFKLQVSPSQLELEGSPDYFSPGAVHAAIGHSTFSIADFTSHSPATNRQLSDLSVSWKSPVAYALHLSGLIEPKEFKADYDKKFEALQWVPWHEVDLSPENATQLNELHGIKGADDINKRIDDAFLAFKQWSNAETTDNRKVAESANHFIEILVEISTKIPDSENKQIILEHIDQVIGQVLKVEEERLDRILLPISRNPGRAAISLDEAVEVATVNDCQYLTPKRAEQLKGQIETALMVFNTWAEASQQDEVGSRKQKLEGILFSCQALLVAKMAEDIKTEPPEYLLNLESFVDAALLQLKDKS